ncbi:hypothetical protein [Reyranella sp. CPCC 100927]|uniref:hypothetical protein n=1 Tax=Reyranella sp. CPCC 100927 TaxID=2599616 RepID=UPI0011B76083|nr:hypothetical protein [Reyranella sp. CPCC 100927]TWS94120.1 hypothetical protein FQU96_41440 [Reyranella sp. CPCC 100927]
MKPVAVLRALSLGAAFIGAAVPAAQAQTPCLVSGDVISGRVAPVTASHPNGSTFTAYILTLSPPRCVTASGQRIAAAQRLQLGGDAAHQAALSRRANAVVTVRIRDPFTPETAWHVGDVIVVDYDIMN